MQKKSTVLLVVALALIDRDHRVLMHKRRADSAHGGLWEFPGGKVEAGETPESALIREASEELGIVLNADDLVTVGFASGMTANLTEARSLVILLYTCAQWEGQPQCLDGEAIEWCELSELSGLDMPPLDYPLAKQVVEKFSKIRN